MHGLHGTRNEYIEMWLDYSVKEEVHISMEDYLKGFINDFPEEITIDYNTPSASKIFDVGDEDDLKSATRRETRTNIPSHSVAIVIIGK